MAQDFKPRSDILPISQRRLWDELVEVPEAFTLYGETAIALHLGHRESVDFDFFSTASFASDRLYASLPFLDGAEVLQSKPDTLTCLVDRGGRCKCLSLVCRVWAAWRSHCAPLTMSLKSPPWSILPA